MGEKMRLIYALAVIMLSVIVISLYTHYKCSSKRTGNYLSIALLGSGIFLILAAVLPYGNFYGRVITTLPTEPNKKIVALTFDDGPYMPYTEQLLDVLAQEGVPATFFVVGNNALRNPALLQKMYAEGHDIGLHTQAHVDLLNLDAEQVSSEISTCKTIVAKITGREAKLLRTPHGFRDWQVISIAKAQGLTLVNWSVSSKDWLSPQAKEISDRTVRQVQPGGIILLHDGDGPYNIGSRANTVQSVRMIINTLKAQGYEFVLLKDYIK